MAEKNRLIRLSDSNSTYVCPVTKSDGVFMSDGNTTLETKMNEVTSQLEQIDQQKASKDDVAKISSGTPLFANSVSGMTDTTKNYVNTTDGYLYIYSSGSWNKTNVQYQSTGIADNSITKNKLDEKINKAINLVDSDYVHDINNYTINQTPGVNRTRILRNSIEQDCIIKKIKFYSSKEGTIKIVILNKTSDLGFVLDKYIYLNDCVVGLNIFDVNISVKKGQYLGVWDEEGKIYISTDKKETYYVITSEPNSTEKQAVIQNDGFLMLSYMWNNAYYVLRDAKIDNNIENINKILGDNTEYYNDFESGSINQIETNNTIILMSKFDYDCKIKKVKINVSANGTIKIMNFERTTGNKFVQKQYKLFSVVKGINIIDVSLDVLEGQYLGVFTNTTNITYSSNSSQKYYSLLGNTNLDTEYLYTLNPNGKLDLSYSIDNISNKVKELENYIGQSGVSGKEIGTGTKGVDYNVSYGYRPLYIQTPYGGDLNQPLHPSVVYIENGLNGYKYWMVESPFPIGGLPYSDRYENPCIHCSKDGVNWTTPIGLINPIDDITQSDINNKNYLSDPHLIYREDLKRLECWYRITYAQEDNHTYILRKTSTDGVNWSNREVIYDCIKGTNEMIRSHGVIFEQNKYKFLYTGWSSEVKYGEWDGVSSWVFKNCTISDNQPIWHLDFGKNPIDNSYYMISYSSENGVKYYKSQNGTDWTFVKTLLVTGDNLTFWNTGLYRSCAVYDGLNWSLYFTATKNNKITSLGLMKGKTLENLSLIDGGNNINTITARNISVDGEILLNNKVKIGYDGEYLYFQREDGTRVAIIK